TWTYTYDVHGRLRTVTPPDSGPVRTWTYDVAYDRLTSETQPESGTTSYGYDAAGNLATKTDAKGNVFHYEYDANERLIKTTVGSTITTIAYEPGTDKPNLTSNGTVQSAYFFDAAGRVSDRR